MAHVDIAKANGLSDSVVRNTHSGALKNLRDDDDLFKVLEAAGKIRDRARREALSAPDAMAA